MAELLLFYGLTIWQLPARYTGGLDHFTTEFLHSQTLILPLHVSPQALATACFICILRQIALFILCYIDPYLSTVWLNKWESLVDGYKFPSMGTFSNFPSQFLSHTVTTHTKLQFEHKLEIRHSLFKYSGQTLINQAGHAVILSLPTL